MMAPDRTLLTVLELIIPLLHLLGIAQAVHAVMTVRTAQGAIAWAVSLVTFPYVAVPLYWVFGRNKFRGYVAAHRSGSARIESALQGLRGDLAAHAAVAAGNARYASLQALAVMPFTGGNGTELLINGDAAFRSMLDAINAARDYVLIQFFIVKNDHVGNLFKQLLIEKAEGGVRVDFLYDELGSHRLSRRYLGEMRAAGVRVSAFNTTKGRGNRFQINFRNHRKLVVVDGHQAFVGGLNIGDEYLGLASRFGGWRDTHLRIRGPAVQALQLTFAEDWHWATGTVPILNWRAEAPTASGRDILVLATGPVDKLDNCQLFFLAIINMARHRLWITSPYFVPDGAVVAALQLAALRGVDVRILLPERPDHYLVHLSAFSYYGEMEAAGVGLYRYQPGFMHQKVALVDDDIAAVGTANLDNRSFRLNFEITAVVADKQFAGEVTVMLERDFAAARRVTSRDYEQRSLAFQAMVRTARLMAPIQ